MKVIVDMLMADKQINIEPKTKEDYELILQEQYGPSWKANASELRLLMDYKQNVWELKGCRYTEVVEATWDL